MNRSENSSSSRESARACSGPPVNGYCLEVDSLFMEESTLPKPAHTNYADLHKLFAA